MNRLKLMTLGVVVCLSLSACTHARHHHRDGEPTKVIQYHDKKHHKDYKMHRHCCMKHMKKVDHEDSSSVDYRNVREAMRISDPTRSY